LATPGSMRGPSCRTICRGHGHAGRRLACTPDSSATDTCGESAGCGADQDAVRHPLWHTHFRSSTPRLPLRDGRGAKKHDWKLNRCGRGFGRQPGCFQRMDGAQLASIRISEHKARTAVTFRRETKVFENAIQQSNFNYVMTLDGVIASRGGIPLCRRQADWRNRCSGRPARRTKSPARSAPRRSSRAWDHRRGETRACPGAILTQVL